MDLPELLVGLAADPDTAVDLAELNFRFAAEIDDPELDLPVYLSKLDDFAEELAPRIRSARSLEDCAMELGHFLFEEQGFAGNTDNYYDARNSFLHEVLDRRLGIPISLSVLAIAVGERCGLEMSGVGLPGHFIAKVSDGDDEVFFDPFHGGALLTPAGCGELVSAVVGEPYAITAGHLKATPPGLIAMRMLNNLKAVYLQGAEFDRAAQVIEWLILLNRNDPIQYRDLGVTLVHADQPGRAIDPLTRYLEASPDSADAHVVKKFLGAARRNVARWN